MVVADVIMTSNVVGASGSVVHQAAYAIDLTSRDALVHRSRWMKQAAGPPILQQWFRWLEVRGGAPSLDSIPTG
jgi:hypothetical protein